MAAVEPGRITALFGFLVKYPDSDRHGLQGVDGGTGYQGPAEGADIDIDVPTERFNDCGVELGIKVIGVDELDDVISLSSYG